MYCGEATTRLDDKGRITVPARMRHTMRANKHSDWYMTRGYDHCISLYPHPVWLELSSQMSQSSPLDPRDLDYRRLIYGSVTEVAPDGQGRIPLPPYLREYAGLDLKEEAVIIGVGQYIEIWNAAAWRAFREAKEKEYKSMGERMCTLKGAADKALSEGEQVRT